MLSRTQWMAGKYGLMIHYLPSVNESEQIDDKVDLFQTELFLKEFDQTGAEWLIFTIGQNTGFYNSPNTVMDRYAGRGHCSRRDLALELAEALHRRGKRFVAYLPCEAHWNKTVGDGFGWERHADYDVEKTYRQSLFQSRWRELIKEWAIRFGKNLDGWWFDGTHAIGMTPIDYENCRSIARAGNPDAAVSFSFGGFDTGIVKDFDGLDDYYAGETTILKDGLPFFAWRNQDIAVNRGWWARRGQPFCEKSSFYPHGMSVPGTQMRWHVLTPIDAFWYHNGPVAWLKDIPQNRYVDPARLKPGEMEPPMYSDDQLRTLVAAFCGKGGGVTLNVGIWGNGSMGEKTLAQLQRIRI